MENVDFFHVTVTPLNLGCLITNYPVLNRPVSVTIFKQSSHILHNISDFIWDGVPEI